MFDLLREHKCLLLPLDVERIPFGPLLQLALDCLDMGKEVSNILGDDVTVWWSEKDIEHILPLQAWSTGLEEEARAARRPAMHV